MEQILYINSSSHWDFTIYSDYSRPSKVHCDFSMFMLISQFRSTCRSAACTKRHDVPIEQIGGFLAVPKWQLGNLWGKPHMCDGASKRKVQVFALHLFSQQPSKIARNSTSQNGKTIWGYQILCLIKINLLWFQTIFVSSLNPKHPKAPTSPTHCNAFPQ